MKKSVQVFCEKKEDGRTHFSIATQIGQETNVDEIAWILSGGISVIINSIDDNEKSAELLRTVINRLEYDFADIDSFGDSTRNDQIIKD